MVDPNPSTRESRDAGTRPRDAGTAPVIRPGPTRLGRAEILAMLGFWLALATLSAIGASLDPRVRVSQGGALPTEVLIPFMQYAVWALLTPLIFRLVYSAGLERPNRVVRILGLLAFGVLVAMFADVVFSYLRFDLFPRVRPPGASGSPRPRPGLFTGLRLFWFLNDYVLYLAVLGAAVARDYSLRLRARHDEAVLLEAETARLETETARLEAETARLNAQLAEARLGALRMQLDPHFLFNTLNAVSAMVERDPEGVRRMIARLSELLRRSLEGAASPETELSRELDFVGRYLEIMQIRFEGDLDVEIDAAPDVLDALVPTLVLQPLVENAIRHGIGEGEHGRKVEVRAEREGDDVVLRVLDDGRGPGGPIVENVGLRNTRERLEALYGSAFRLDVAARSEGGAGPGRGTRAEIRLPYHTAADLRAAGVSDAGADA